MASFSNSPLPRPSCQGPLPPEFSLSVALRDPSGFKQELQLVLANIGIPTDLAEPQRLSGVSGFVSNARMQEIALELAGHFKYSDKEIAALVMRAALWGGANECVFGRAAVALNRISEPLAAQVAYLATYSHAKDMGEWAMQFLAKFHTPLAQFRALELSLHSSPRSEGRDARRYAEDHATRCWARDWLVNLGIAPFLLEDPSDKEEFARTSLAPGTSRPLLLECYPVNGEACFIDKYGRDKLNAFVDLVELALPLLQPAEVGKKLQSLTLLLERGQQSLAIGLLSTLLGDPLEDSKWAIAQLRLIDAKVADSLDQLLTPRFDIPLRLDSY